MNHPLHTQKGVKGFVKVPPQERFWWRVEKQSVATSPNVKTPCWIWTSGTNKKGGYGQFYVGNKAFVASRWIYQQIHGELDATIQVCHKCDNPKCVNPDHLFAGTATENYYDSIRKGRMKISPRRTHCVNGHELVGDNVSEYKTKTGTTNRRCRKCKNERERIAYHGQ